MQKKCSSLEVLVLQSWNRKSFCWLEGWDDFWGAGLRLLLLLEVLVESFSA